MLGAGSKGPLLLHALWYQPGVRLQHVPAASQHVLLLLSPPTCSCSWRRMFLDVPHVRFDGVYVARNTYIRIGAVELHRSNTVHLACYYRYYRFFPNGQVRPCLWRRRPDSGMRTQGRDGSLIVCCTQTICPLEAAAHQP